MQQTTKKVITINAENKILGRLASEIALILQGKNKVSYKPNVLCGDIVEVRNTDKIKISGHKSEQKEYKRFSGYPSGLKITGYQKLFAKSPEKVLQLAVKRMLPKNRLQNEMLKKLKFVK